MPFQFSLQEVLDHRRHIEDARRNEMNETRARAQYVEGLITQAEQRRGAYRRELSEKTQQGLGAAYQDLYLNYIEGIDDLIERSREHLGHLQKEVERRREILLRAARERRVMEEFRKEEQREYLVMERRAEAKAYDEISIRNFLQASREKVAASEKETRS